MVCPEGCGRGSAYAGSAAAGHSRLLAEGTKEEEKREDDVAVLGLGGRWEGTTEKGQLAGQIAFPEPSCSWQLLPARRRRRSWPPVPSFWGKAERKSGRGGEVSVLAPRLLRSFPGTFLIDGYLSHAFPNLLLE